MGNERQVCQRCCKIDDVEVMRMYADYWVHAGVCPNPDYYTCDECGWMWTDHWQCQCKNGDK